MRFTSFGVVAPAVVVIASGSLWPPLLLPGKQLVDAGLTFLCHQITGLNV
jgi:hypothetical protein